MIGEVLSDLRKEIGQTTEALRRELARVRTGRASTALLDGVMVEYYGAKTHLNQLASVTAPEPRLLVVTPYDRSVMGEIEKAIKKSDLGLNPMNDGKVIRLPIPELTEERRRDLVKHIRKVAEEYRVSMRNHRRDANALLKDLLKEKQIAEDDFRHAQEKVQALTDEGITQIDRTLKAKEEEIMAV